MQQPQLYLSNKQLISGLTDKQISLVKSSLTFDNPAYFAAKRYSKNRYITIPPYLEFYKEVENGIEVPIGFDVDSVLSTQSIVFMDNRVDVPVEYPEFCLTLRPDQQKAKEAFLFTQKEKIPHNLIHLPTGKGKTILALNLAYTLGQKTLILVHKDDLVTGWQKDIDLCFNCNVAAGLIKAKKRVLGKQITIATVQTLSRMSPEELKAYTSMFGFVIQDEAHHIGLKIFNIIDQFNSKYKLGLSATPQRSDGLDFVFDLFLGGIGYKHEYSKNDNDILPVKVITRYSRAEYRPFIYDNQVFNACDFSKNELPCDLKWVKDIPYEQRPQIPFFTIDNALVRSKKHKLKVCHDILTEYRKGHSCIAFFNQKEHILMYFNYLKNFVPANEILLYYGDNKESSDVMMQKAESRQCLITLATYAKATEGTNVKAWEVGFLVSSLNNEKNVEQALGRIRRSADNKLNQAILYDYRFPKSYSVSNHGRTKDKVYTKLKLDFVPEFVDKRGEGLFSKGY